LKAKGNIEIDFAENALIEAGGTVKINKSLVNCTVKAGKKIEVTGTPGCVIGGFLHAGISIDVLSAGSSFGVKTYFSSGKNFIAEQELEKITGRILFLTQSITEMKKIITSLVEKGIKLNTLPENRKTVITDILVKLKKFPAELAEEQIREKAAAAAVYTSESPCIKVKNTAFQGVTLHIRNAAYEIKNEEHFVCYTENPEDKTIMIGSYE